MPKSEPPEAVEAVAESFVVSLPKWKSCRKRWIPIRTRITKAITKVIKKTITKVIKKRLRRIKQVTIRKTITRMQAEEADAIADEMHEEALAAGGVSCRHGEEHLAEHEEGHGEEHGGEHAGEHAGVDGEVHEEFNAAAEAFASRGGSAADECACVF